MEQLGAVLPFVLLALVFWLLVVRPTRRRQQELARIQGSLQLGSEVMLSAGIFGVVTGIPDDPADNVVAVEVAPGTVLKVARQAVARVVETSSTDPRTDRQ